MENTSSELRVVIVTGLSGSGKSVAIRQLEDSGYYCLDNLPLDFLLPVLEKLHSRGIDRIAVAVDARGLTNSEQFTDCLAALRARKIDVRILFLTASNTELVKRFSETCRRHPLSIRPESQSGRTLSEAIHLERDLLSPIAEQAHIIDTTRVLPNTLRRWVTEFADIPPSSMTLDFESFAFKKGIPVAADLVFDVRNLPNPFYDEALRPLTGLDKPVINYLDSQSQVQDMLSDITAFIDKWLPSYESQNRHYLTVAIGCTGGQHRSVYIAEHLAKAFKAKVLTVVRHRQLCQRDA